MTTAITPVNDLLRIVGRAAEITGSYGRTRTKPERVDAMTRAMLIVEHTHQELSTFARFIYRQNDHGQNLHILPDGQLAPGVWAPWTVHAPSTLTRTQRDLLRRWLLLKADNRLRPPFVYGDDTRRWYVDLRRYPTVEAALDWLEKHKLTAGEWLNLLPQVSKRMSRGEGPGERR
jgi:hypothetical protein